MSFNFKNRTATILCNVFCLVLISLFQLQLTAQNAIQVAGTPTKTAVQSGNWASPSTWGGSLPNNNARVLIPANITVTVDNKIATEFKSVKIEGILKFATNKDTELRTEYIVSTMMGKLEIGTANDPIPTNVKASLVFAERGGTSQSEDPQRFAPGAVLMGTTTMHGASKTSWLALQAHPSAGTTQFVLKSAPTGWQVGDKLVVAGTDPITNASISSTAELGSDEVVTITGVSGNTVNFTPALKRNHKAPAQASDLAVHVANLSRNIVISSENTSVKSISGNFRKPRGHMMFMHTLNVDLKYVEANNLGRTDKSIILDDWDFDELARDPNTGNPVSNGGRNPRGRYSIHFHRGGLDASVIPAKPITPLPTPAKVEGCVVNTDPGWGYVNHSARVDFVKNVSFNVVGGAFNTEAGNETGSFVENIAIRTINPENPILVAPHTRNSYTDGDATSSLADLREGRQDFAWQGDGFWLHGTGVTVKGNIVTGCTGHAYVYWTDGLIEKGLGMARGDIDAHVPAAEFPTQNRLLKDWKARYPNFALDIWYLQPRPFTNNTAYNFARGVTTYYVHTEFHQANDPNEGGYEERFNNLPPAYKDQLNLIFDNTTLWNIGRRGFTPEISANITIQNSRVVGYNARTGFENYGTNPNPNFVNYDPAVIGIDLDHFHNTHRWVLNNNIVEGFSGNAVGIALPKNGLTTVNGGTFNNTGTDILVGCASEHISDGDEGLGVGMLSTNPKKSEVLIRGVINFQNSNNNIVMDAEIIYDAIAGEGFPLLEGAKSDDTYFFAPQEVTLNFGPFNNATAYFNEQAANHIPITSTNRCTFSEEGESCVASRYVGKTNAQLKSQYNNSFSGTITPSTAVRHAMIVNGKVSAISGNPCAANGGDTDNDGICADNDCNDNDASIGAKQTAGTPCDDGNVLTQNDVIQVDGCSCAGTIFDDCANNGGDADKDGICADYDCNDNNASIGAKQTAGTPCDDGNALTQNDVIQADGCACAGTVSNTNAFPANAKILCLGDSRVEGDANFESYRYDFWKDLVDCSWDFDLVGTINDPLSYPAYQNKTFDPDHEGVGGYTTTDVLEDLPEVLSSLGKIDMVLLGIGGNDALEGGSNSVPTAIANINSIIDLLQSNNPNILILLEQIAPGMSNIMTADLTRALNDLNSQIPTIASNQTNGSSRVIVVDMAAGWQDSYLADEVHYNSTGAELVATRYANALKALYTCGNAEGEDEDDTDTDTDDGSDNGNPGGGDNDGGCTWSNINNNDFESGWGIWNDGGIDSRRGIYEDLTASGDYAIRLRDNTNASVMTTDNIDLSSYNEIKVAFAYICESMDNANEDFWLQISTDGGSSFTTLEEWNRGDEFENGEQKSDEVTISGITFTANTQLRFRCDASANGDKVYIDDVTISGCGDDSNGGNEDGSGDGENGDGNDIINLVNFSFEEPGQGEYVDDFSLIPGWNKSGDGESGVERGWGEPTHGNWLCFHYAGDSYINQTLNHNIQAGKIYMLELDAIDLEEGGASAQVLLRYGSNTIKNTRLALSENWQTMTITFNANDYPNAIGQQLRILFRNNGAEDTYAGFDNFRLSVTPAANAITTRIAKIRNNSQQLDNQTLKVFPNPIKLNQDLTLAISGFSKDALVTIFNATGRMRYQGNAQDNLNIPTQGLPVGLYFVQVNDKTRSKITRFVVQDW